MAARNKKAGGQHPRLVTFLSVAAAILAIAVLAVAPGDPRIKFLLGAAAMALAGIMIRGANGLDGAYGLYLLGSKKGVDLIDGLAKGRARFWKLFTDWGLSLGFGLAGYPHFRKHVDKRVFLFGLVSLLLIVVFVFPYLSVILAFIPQYSSGVSASAASSSASSSGSGLISLLLVAAVLAGGLSLLTIVLILYSGVEVVYVVLAFLKTVASSSPNYSILTQQAPGVTPVIPGLTIPLAAGVISLFILLVVHEASHGVLARLSKVKIKSMGVVLFGIIPFGAYVEPDERAIKKLKASAQERIFIAGITSNMATSVLFFALTILMLYAVFPGIDTGGVLVTAVVHNSPAYNVIAVNTVITAWNGQPIRNIYQLSDVESKYVKGYVVLNTSRGAVAIQPASGGKLGVGVAPDSDPLALQAADFAYAVVALSFTLNFFVAIFNLLPIPGFDGWRVYQNSIRNKRILYALLVLVVASILLNALPWLWTI